jgi:protein gp37
MSSKSAIGWTDATWNPITGCSKVSPGCAHCYAESLTRRFASTWDVPDLPWTPENAEANVILHPERLDQPLRWKKPRMVFVNSMSDLFHEQIEDEVLAYIFAVMALAPQHTFQVLTKRPERMKEFFTRELEPNVGWLPGSYAAGLIGQAISGVGPDLLRGEEAIALYDDPTSLQLPLRNVWLGTSIENRRYVHRADLLRETPAAVRFISAEPLLGPLLCEEEQTEDPLWVDDYDGPQLYLNDIDWLIVGGESGPGHRPMREEWVRDLRDACRCYICGGRGRRSSRVNELAREVENVCPDCHGTGNLVAFFFKQWGGATPKAGGRELDGRTWDEMLASSKESQR